MGWLLEPSPFSAAKSRAIAVVWIRSLRTSASISKLDCAINFLEKLVFEVNIFGLMVIFPRVMSASLLSAPGFSATQFAVPGVNCLGKLTVPDKFSKTLAPA